VQDCDRIGVPPVQPAGDDVATVLVWVLSDWQAPQAEYVNEEQVGAFQVLVSWHPGEQELAVALKFMEAAVFTVPFWCVVAVTTVLVYPTPWQALHWYASDELWKECWPDDGGMAWQLPHAGVGDTSVQDCERTGVPPVQPAGDDAATVRVCVPFVHVPQSLYVNEEQVLDAADTAGPAGMLSG
jgi:hypothetical protein